MTSENPSCSKSELNTDKGKIIPIFTNFSLVDSPHYIKDVKGEKEILSEFVHWARCLY